jgi:Ni/Co efflux regulator RcnB
MRKFLTTALAAAMLAGPILAAATPASADRYRDHGYRHHRKDSDKAAIAVAAGIAGLALGAALSSRSNGRPTYSSGYSTRSYPYSNGYDYDPRDDSYGGEYYGRGYGYDDSYRRAPAVCTTTERVYDRYSGRRVMVERRYAC